MFVVLNEQLVEKHMHTYLSRKKIVLKLISNRNCDKIDCNYSYEFSVKLDSIQY